MKTRLAAAVSAVVFALAAGAWCERAARAQGVTVKAPPEMDARNWKEYAPPGEGFSVLLPGVPRKQTMPRPMPDGQMLTVHVHVLNTSAEYVVMYTDFPFTVSGPEMAKQILDAGAEGAAEPGLRELVSVTEISQGGHPGRDIKVKIGNRGTGRARIYLVGSRLYQAIIATPSVDGAPESAVKFNEERTTKFLDSFKLTGTQIYSASDVPPPPPPMPVGPRAEGEVDRMLKELKAKDDEVLVGVCPDIENCKPLESAVSERLKVGTVVSKPVPDYPAIAKAARAQGTVTVQLIVDEEGNVLAAQAVSGHPLLQQAAVKAAREARFTPTLLDGKPRKVAGVITYNFVLQ